jgi:hypothetical protein
MDKILSDKIDNNCRERKVVIKIPLSLFKNDSILLKDI